MLLSRKVVFKNDQLNNDILRHMGYSAYKLWNVGNYEKRHYKKLGMDQYPNWYEQKKRLKSNFFYKNLPSQSGQDVLKLLEEAWDSYRSLLKTGGVSNPKPPRFKKQLMSVTFLKDAIKQNGSEVRLTISKQLKTYLKEQGVNANFIYLKTKRFSDIHIKELQIKFLNENDFLAIAVYEAKSKPMHADNGRYLSIDLGLKNNFTCYDSRGDAFILSGFLKATHYYDKAIAYYQAISDKQQIEKGVKYPDKTKRVLNLYKKKKHCVNDFLHKATRYITDYCHHNHIHTVVIGDIKGIRKDKNLGRTNQQLHTFPYQKTYKMLAYKLKRLGITLIRQKEAYSSQCPPDSPSVSKAYAAKKNRKHRGLYDTGVAVYNADCVGAYNILRLFLAGSDKQVPAYRNLSSPIKVTV